MPRRFGSVRLPAERRNSEPHFFMRFWLRTRTDLRLSPTPWSSRSGPLTRHLRPQTLSAALYSAAVFLSVLDFVGPVGCVALFVSFQKLNSLTNGNFLRNALNALVYALALGIEQGFAGQRLPPAGLNATSGFSFAFLTASIHCLTRTGSFVTASHGRISRVRLTFNFLKLGSVKVVAF